MTNGTVHNVFPREFVDVIVHSAGVGDQFHAIIQRAVCLDVKQVGVGIGNVQQLFGIIIVSACSVDFQFDAEIAVTFAVEMGFGL